MTCTSRFVLLFFVSSTTAVLGQLFLGPCGPPPKHISHVKLTDYAGLWYVAATTDDDYKNDTCNAINYGFDREVYHLKFISKFEEGYIETKNNPNYPGEMQKVFDNSPRSQRFYILSTDYNSTAVEYTCLPGVFKKKESIRILTRNPANATLLKTKEFAKNIPANFMPQLQVVLGTDCAEIEHLKPCSNLTLKKVHVNSKCNQLLSSPLLPLFTSLLSNRM